jgi:MFS family permease
MWFMSAHIKYLPLYLVSFFSVSLQSILLLVVPLWALFLKASPLEIGLAIGAFSFLPIFYSLSFGALIDRFGSRAILRIMSGLATVIIALYPIVPYIWPLIALQMIFGLIHAVLWIGAQAYMLKLINSGTRFSYNSVFSFAANLGLLLGPLLMGIVWDWRGPIWVFSAIVLWACGMLVSALLLPAEENIGHGERTDLFKNIREGFHLLPQWRDAKKAMLLLAIPQVLLTVYAAFLRLSAYTIRSSFFLVYLESLSFSATAISMLFSTMALVATLSSLTVDFFLKFADEKKLLFIVYAGVFITLSLPPLFTNFAEFVFLTAVAGFFLGLTLPLILSTLSGGVEPDSQGLAISLRELGNRVAGLSVPLMFGLFAGQFGLAYSFFITGGLYLLSMAVIFPLFLKRNPSIPEADCQKMKAHKS